MGFREKVYYRENFAKLAFSGELIEAETFEECEFNKCSFIDCKLEKCKFLSCQLNECTLSAINPAESRFLEVKFSACKVIGFDWTRAAKIDGLEFAGCQINYSNFKLLKLPGIRIINCEAKEVDFIETDMSAGIFKNTDFEKSRFFKTNLSNADFKGAKNYSIDVQNNILKKTRFSLPEALALLNSLYIILE
jgi:fluoroquinolone resistance protein